MDHGAAISPGRPGEMARAAGPQVDEFIAVPIPVSPRISVPRSHPGRRRPGALALSPPPAAGDWDGEMQAYPQIVEDGGRTLVLYNGNGFGRDGFGAALLQPSTDG